MSKEATATTAMHANHATQFTAEEVTDYENISRHIAEMDMDTKSGGSELLNMMTSDDSMGGLWTSEFRAWVDSHILKSLFFSEDWVFICVDLIASKLSSQPLTITKGSTQDGKFVKTPAEGHELLELFENPNEYQSYEAWMYSGIVDLMLCGNDLCWYARQLNQIMNIPAETVMLDFSRGGQLERYMVTEVTMEQEISRRNTSYFEKEEIIHVRRPNPSSVLWGLSPFIPARKSVLFNRYSQEYLNSFYQKGALPGFALMLEKDANEKVAMRLLRSFENAYTGRRNQRRTLILPKGVSMKETAHTLANQELSIHVDKNRETIIAILKVPKHEVGLQKSGSLGSEEYKTALKNFWYAMLIPTQKMKAGALTRFFRANGRLAADEFVEFDNTGVEILQEDEMTKANLAEKMLKTHTLNEVRKKVYNIESVPEGNTVIGFMPTAGAFNGLAPIPGVPVPDTSVPANGAEGVEGDATAENQVTTPTASLNGSQVMSLLQIVTDYNNGNIQRDSAVNIIRVSFAVSSADAEAILGTGSVKPAAQQNPSTQPTNQPQAPAAPGVENNAVTQGFQTEDGGEIVQIPVEENKAETVIESKDPVAGKPTKAAREKLDVYLKGSNDWFAAREQKVRAEVQLGQDAMERIALRMFADMAAKIIETTKGFLVAKNWDVSRLATKAEGTAGDGGGGARFIKKTELRRRLRKALDRYEERWISDTRKALLARVEAGYGIALEMPFNFPSKKEIHGLRVRGASIREDALAEREGRAFAYMNETTIDRVYSTIEKGIDAGKTVQDIAIDLKEKFSDVKEIGARAMMIARTETLTAVSLGQAAAMADASKFIPDLQKMWISADDERTRESHRELHGDIVSYKDEFANGLQFPRDPSGPPEETIQCRCAWLMVPKDQMSSIDDSLKADEEVE